MIIYHFDSQAFSLAAVDMHGLKLAALYTLQHGLARNTEELGCILHWDITFRR